MKKNFYLLLLLVLVATAALSYRISYSFFSDQAQSRGNVFGASTAFPTATPTNTPTPTPITTTPTPTPHIVINEVFTNGGSSGSNWKDQWIELYNQTSSTINISGWTITIFTGSDVIPTVTPIPANGYAVIYAKHFSLTIPTSSQIIKIDLGTDKIGNGFNETGDFVRLSNGTITIDQMSYGNDPTVFPTPGPTPPTSSQSLYRHPNGTDTDNAVDWVTSSSKTIGASNP